MRNTAEHNVIKSADLTVFPQSGQVEIKGHVVSLGLVNMQVLLVLLAILALVLIVQFIGDM